MFNLKKCLTKIKDMKKVNYLLTVLFAVALMSTSCEKDDPVVPDLTVSDLIGHWTTLTFEYDGNTYSDCAELDNSGIAEVEDAKWALLDIIIESATDFEIVDNCGADTYGNEIIINGNEVTFKNMGVLFRFMVLNYETNVLELELLYENVENVGLVGGKYYLTK